MKNLSDCNILIVDDTNFNIKILEDTLKSDYKISVALDGKSALKFMEEVIPDIILLDIMMPEMDGFEVFSKIKEDIRLKDIPVVFLSAVTDINSKAKAFEMGAVDYITKPFEVTEVRARVKTHLSLQLAQKELTMQNEILNFKVEERTREIALTQEATLETIANLAEYRDPETGGHINRTKGYIKVLAERLKEHPKYKDIINDTVIRIYYKACPLHDIGKIGIRDEILLKPGKLTPSEFEEMKHHTTIGYETLKMAANQLGENSFLTYAMEFALHHHEKWDGTGYPDGLKGEEIPISCRLMAIADVYDALISKRIYKPAFSHNKSVSIILEGNGTHFDPELIEIFIELNEEFRKIAIQFADSEEERLNLEHNLIKD
ncbi:two-component system response regulator [Clostridium sp. C2-6-12]|uniref:HD-GYP domain-containing protein n=1 Tax=Clostridium sp. C2-6-12 TaxID=2698832 RepID=UPI001370E2DC|nr:two-component system response regulator [Clostridium sp. C2-6-12]